VGSSLRTAAGALISLAAIAASSPAAGSAFDVLGFGPTGVAEVNARAARADDGTAAFYSPGGLALGNGVRAEVAPSFGVSQLRAQGETIALADPFGVALAFDATIPFTGVLKDRIRIGFGGYLPPSHALYLVARKSAEPFYPYYDNRTQRLVVIPAIAVRITDRLGVGLGLNVLGGVSGPASVQNGASGAPEPHLDLTAATSVAVNAGARFDPAPGVRLALTVRQQFAAPAVVDTTAVIAGAPLAVSVATRSALFDPTTIVAAASFDVGRAAVEVDASYAVWSAYDGPWVGVKATLPGVNLLSALPTKIARDVVSLRAAGSYRIGVGAQSQLVLRAGTGFEPSMLTNYRQGVTNLVDGHKLLGGLGASFALRGVLPVALRFGAGANVTRVFPYSQEKRVCTVVPCALDTVSGSDANDPGKGITNPGYPKLEGQGAFWSVSAGVGVDL
jgi:hypothetical protein